MLKLKINQMSKKIDKAVFIPTNKYISFFSGTPKIFSWIFKRMSDESIENLSTANNSFSPR